MKPSKMGKSLMRRASSLLLRKKTLVEEDDQSIGSLVGMIITITPDTPQESQAQTLPGLVLVARPQSPDDECTSKDQPWSSCDNKENSMDKSYTHRASISEETQDTTPISCCNEEEQQERRIKRDLYYKNRRVSVSRSC